MTDSAVHEFFSNGCQYYIAGRYGAFAGLNTVVGNLLHHAIEHFLKGVLAKTKSLKELKKLLHNLPAIWDAFKAQVNDPTLARFDDVISRLHKFEDLRYPDPNEPGMLCHIELTKARAAEVAAMIASTPTSAPTSTLPQYDLILEEIDELVAVIFAAASLEPKAYFGRRLGHQRGNTSSKTTWCVRSSMLFHLFPRDRAANSASERESRRLPADC
jgi:hypothetical protein